MYARLFGVRERCCVCAKPTKLLVATVGDNASLRPIV